MKRKMAILMLGAVVGAAAAGAEPGARAVHPLGMSPVCTIPQQCVAMWSAARKWVRNTCGYKLERDTEDLLETYNTVNNTVPRQVSRSLACHVTRTPRPEGGYVFTVMASCSATTPRSNPCYPPADEAMSDFNRSLNAVAARLRH